MVEELRGVFLVWLLYMGTDLAHTIIGRLLRSYTTPPVPQPSYRDQRDPWWVNEAIRRSLPGFIAKSIGDGSRIRAKTLEIWFDVDGWRALAVGTVTLITVGPVCRAGAACVGFVLPTIAALRCGRAPPSRPCYRDLAAATDARARTYLAYGAVLGVREVLLLHDSVRQVYSICLSGITSTSSSSCGCSCRCFRVPSRCTRGGRGVTWRSWRSSATRTKFCFFVSSAASTAEAVVTVLGLVGVASPRGELARAEAHAVL